MYRWVDLKFHFKSKELDEPNIVKIFTFGRLLLVLVLGSGNSCCLWDSTSVCDGNVRIMITSFWPTFRKTKTIILTTIVATIAPARHATSVKISCGAPSVETLGTEINRKTQISYFYAINSILIWYTFHLTFTQTWVKLIINDFSEKRNTPFVVITISNLILLTYTSAPF